MGVSCCSVSFIIVTCDLCRTTEHRCHEVVAQHPRGDMGDFLRQHEGKAIESLPAGWSVTVGTKADKDARRYVCPACVHEVESSIKC
jgi:hypothetical protein